MQGADHCYITIFGRLSALRTQTGLVPALGDWAIVTHSTWSHRRPAPLARILRYPRRKCLQRFPSPHLTATRPPRTARTSRARGSTSPGLIWLSAVARGRLPCCSSPPLSPAPGPPPGLLSFTYWRCCSIIRISWPRFIVLTILTTSSQNIVSSPFTSHCSLLARASLPTSGIPYCHGFSLSTSVGAHGITPDKTMDC